MDDDREAPGSRLTEGSRHTRFSTYGWIVLGLAVAGLVAYLVTDHLPHVFGALPYVALIAVTVGHFFMHRGHGGHGGHGGDSAEGRHKAAQSDDRRP